jgi:hypothetical protein
MVGHDGAAERAAGRAEQRPRTIMNGLGIRQTLPK